jgi:hypothetical protein
MTLRIIPALLLFCLLGADQAEKPKLSAIRLYEQRNKFLAKQTSIGGYERLAVTLRLEGIKDVRSYGNLKITEAKTDTGANLIRRAKDEGSFFAITNVPSFDVVRDYQAKSGKVDFDVILHRTPRGSKKVSLKGSLEVLTGGEPTHIDFANFLGPGALEDDALTAVGLKISTNKDGRNTDTQLSYSISGDNSALVEISLIDASGTKIKTTGGYYYYRSSSRGGGSYSLSSLQKIPKDAKLRVTLIKGGKRTTLPFAYDLELP